MAGVEAGMPSGGFQMTSGRFILWCPVFGGLTELIWPFTRSQTRRTNMSDASERVFT